jgi:hypothetical protein
VTWATHAKRLGRRPVQVLELDLDSCALAYGTAPCTAVLGVTGATKCFNTYPTCQSRPNFAKTTKTVRFSSLPLDPTVGAIPSIISSDYAPTKIDPGQGLGVRASVTIRLQDHRHNDSGQDPYLGSRGYDARDRGTFWPRFIARNRFYQARTLRLLTGYLTESGAFDPANFITSTFVIERIDGPDRNGQVTITGKDLLKLADDKRAQVPTATKGTLAADLTATGATFTMTPVDAADAYGPSGTVCIDREIMTFTRAGATFTVTRATDGTTADEHRTGDKVQLCLRYTNTLAHSIIYDLLTVHAGIPATFIDKPAWDAEAAVWLPDTVFSTVLTKPEGITTLLAELAESASLYLWWDERTQKIRLRAIRPALPTEVRSWNDNEHFLSNSVQLTEKPDDRVSQLWIYYGKADPTEDAKPENFTRVAIHADTDAESPLQYGESRIKTILSRWIPATNPSPAVKLGYAWLSKYRDNPRVLKVQIDAKDAAAWTGDIVHITSAAIQDATGTPVQVEWQIIEAKEITAGTTYELTLTETFFRGRYGYVLADSAPSYATASEAQRALGCFMSLPNGEMSDGLQGYQIV